MTTQPLLTLADISKRRDGTTVPAEEAAFFLAAKWDVWMFPGYITRSEANRRLAAQDQALSGLLQIPGSGELTYKWAIFVRHEESCDTLSYRTAAKDGYPDEIDIDPQTLCTCDMPWFANWVLPGTDGAIAVTTAYADRVQGAVR